MPDFSHVKAICFDVDSTICPGESIDILAAYCHKGEIVRQITNQAMEGKMDFAEAFEERLKILRLSKALIQSYMDDSPLELTPGVERLFASLRANGVDLYLASGGIMELVDRVAKRLRIPEDHVFSNRLIYNDEGLAVNFDRQQPTSRSNGKREVVAAIKSRMTNPSEAGVLIVGDGATDAAACPPADAFLGFGGVVVRPSVQSATPFFFYSFDEMHTFLQRSGLIVYPS